MRMYTHPLLELADTLLSALKYPCPSLDIRVPSAIQHPRVAHVYVVYSRHLIYSTHHEKYALVVPPPHLGLTIITRLFSSPPIAGPDDGCTILSGRPQLTPMTRKSVLSNIVVHRRECKFNYARRLSQTPFMLTSVRRTHNLTRPELNYIEL